jgi:hypothetical protein
MDKDRIDRIDACKDLLPEPAPEVVGELISEVRRLNKRILALNDRLAEMENEYIV